jgi:MerR family transcriptional regulator, light-induced transcriptional regulator
VNPTGDGLTAGEVARRLGIAVTTLRSWHRRYGLGPRQHRAGRHRRYSVDDLRCLDVMCRLTAGGMRAAEAARLARAHYATGSTATPADPSRPAKPAPGRARLRREMLGLSHAAARLDSRTMSTLIGAAVRDHGVVPTWNLMLRPVLSRIAARHVATGELIEVEHLLSQVIAITFAGVTVEAAADPPRTLLACAGGEQHTLAVEAFAAALAEQGHASRFLGPTSHLRRSSPPSAAPAPGSSCSGPTAAATLPPRNSTSCATPRRRHH